MKQQSIHLFFFMLTVISFIACNKNDSNTVIPVTATNVWNIAADTSNKEHFAFYSLETGKQIVLEDSATTKWDIAFKKSTIIINGGTSGPGQGGAFVQRGIAFENYTTILVDSTFYTDGVNGVTYAIKTGSGKGWYSYDMNNHIMTPIAGNLIIIKTASGKYAKIEITSYYKDAPVNPTAASVPAYYTFKYTFQANGNKSF